ncbi:DUF3572 domain-containing protein [Xanthobacter dioxanivorans]|uniref:DUF3572 domain-containing protein n=1 Tax=Xanthobacter dioxanivorans TaxID=2528964 RepID=A0A974PKZ9_9HYPH|nr:DUF3572 domain-containing protein [Xanthobacter dioxanivorans]QRG05226.1 DUF3572 domain-containing protein [Xanthobacter dioxanivorans]
MPIQDKPRGLKAQRDAAQDVAVSALAFIAADGERLVRFLSETGLSPATLRDAAARRDFGAGVLAFILSDEPMLLAFAAEQGLDPRHVAGAHDILAPHADPDATVRRPM